MEMISEVITQKLNQNDMDLDICMRVITFPVACYVLMTARSAVGAQEFIFKLNCRSHVMRKYF